MKKQCLLLAFLLCRHIFVYSQYSISGIVNDPNGTALPGASIQLEGTFHVTLTDVNGKFNLQGLKQGNYQLIISYLGFETVNDTIHLVKKRIPVLTFSLKEKPFLSEEVIVTATRAPENAPVTKSNFSQNEIREQNTGQDVPYILGLTTSAVTTADAGTGIGYTGLRIRGTDMTGINVTINGIPYNDAESHGVYWVDIPDIATSTDNLQIQRGVGASTHGSGAFGATINLQTTSLKTKPYVELNNEFGSFDSWHNSVSFGSGMLDDHFSLDGRLSSITSNGYVDRGWSELSSYYMAGSWYSNKSLLKFILFSGTEHTYQAWNGVPDTLLHKDRTFNPLGYEYTGPDGISHFYNNQTDNYVQNNFQLLYSHSFLNNLSLNGALFFTHGSGYYEEYISTVNTNTNSEDSLYMYGLPNVITYNAGLPDTIKTANIIRQQWLDNVLYGGTWSLNYAKNNITAILGGGWNQYFGKHFGNVIWAQYFVNGNMDQQYYYNSGTKNDFNLFAKINYQVADALWIYADLQFRQVIHSLHGMDDTNTYLITQSHTYNFFNPKFGITYNLSSNQNIYGYFGMGHREPTRDNFVDADPITLIPKPETLYDVEFGYRSLSEYVQLGINAYMMYYSDQLILTGKIDDVGSPVFTNVPVSYRMGLEGNLLVKFSKRLTWDVNATLSRNIIENFVSYTDDYDSTAQKVQALGNREIAFSPSLIAGSQLHFEIIKYLTITLQTKYVGLQYIDNTQDNTRKLSPYIVNDLRFNYKIRTKILHDVEFILKVNNLLNENYCSNAWVYPYIQNKTLQIQDGYFPQAFRNAMGGLMVSF